MDSNRPDVRSTRTRNGDGGSSKLTDDVKENNMAELNLDTFGEIMDKFINDAHIQLLIDMPEGTTEARLKDNTGMGSVMQFYIILNAVEAIYKDMLNQMDIKDSDDALLDSLLDLLKQSIKGKEED